MNRDDLDASRAILCGLILALALWSIIGYAVYHLLFACR